MPHRYPRHGLFRRTRMQRITSGLTIILCLPLQTLFATIPLKTHAATSVIIEEIAWAGSSASIADEWIELANLGDTTTTIAGWTLKGAGASGRDISIPEGAEIPPNGTYVIANYAETDEKSALLNPVQLATSTISLSNNQLQIELFDTDQLLIDRAGNGSSPLAGTTDPLASMMRTDAAIQGDQASAWISATSSNGFKEGIHDFGTPGFCDLCYLNAGDWELGTGNWTNEIDTRSSSTTPLISNDIDISSNTTTQQTIYATNTTSTQTSSTIPFTDTNASSNTTNTTSTESIITQSSDNSHLPLTTYHLPILLNEIISNPLSGSEWVELVFPEGTTSTDRELILYDGQGKIATIASSTPLTASPYLLFQLPSSKLNNGGDELSIRETDGTIIQKTTIPSLEKGESWARNPENETWSITETLTPASENSIYQTPVSNSNSNSNSNSVVSASINTTVPSATTNVTTQQTTNAIVSLNEIVSNPSSGPEWIELYFPSDATSTDRVLVLRDSKTTIKTIPTHTPLTLPHYLIVALAGSKLTNAGEAVSITEASGTVIETTTIPKLAKGYSWSKASDRTWEITERPTPASANQFTSSVAETDEATSFNLTTSSTKQTIDADIANKNENENLEEIFSSAKATTQEIKSSSLTKKSTTKSSDLVTPYPFNAMFDETLNSVRARVIGTVASIPKLFGASHVFVLQNEDGKGLIVYVPTHLHIPEFGSTVRVDGTLTLTDYGPQIRMKKTDIWMSMTTSTTPKPRTVDLLTPGSEDAWSLISIQGTVTTIDATSFTIETEDALTVTISTPSVVGFRTKRLVKGDTIQATGLLNIKKLTPTIIIRTPDDIVLTKHAPDTVTISNSTSTSAQTKNRFPDWAPFASAGVAIVGTGGAKRLREEMRKRQLKKLMKKARENE